jgi:hypothetical protein
VAACSDEPTLRRLPEPETQVDELKQKPAAQVDILWVVDNSQSMVEEQASLAQNFGKFFTFSSFRGFRRSLQSHSILNFWKSFGARLTDPE